VPLLLIKPAFCSRFHRFHLIRLRNEAPACRLFLVVCDARDQSFFTGYALPTDPYFARQSEMEIVIESKQIRRWQRASVEPLKNS